MEARVAALLPTVLTPRIAQMTIYRLFYPPYWSSGEKPTCFAKNAENRGFESHTCEKLRFFFLSFSPFFLVFLRGRFSTAFQAISFSIVQTGNDESWVARAFSSLCRGAASFGDLTRKAPHEDESMLMIPSKLSKRDSLSTTYQANSFSIVQTGDY